MPIEGAAPSQTPRDFGSDRGSEGAEPPPLDDESRVPLDAWFALDEIVSSSSSRRALILRGRIREDDEPVILKCRAMCPYAGSARDVVRNELVRYEANVCAHALPVLSNDEFFVEHVRTTRRRWDFESVDDLERNPPAGTADRVLLRWMRLLPYDSVDDLDAGAEIIVTRDAGPTTAWRHLVRRSSTTEEDVAAFVAQMLCALDVMEDAELVHGDLRWQNVAYPPIPPDGKRFFDLRAEGFVRENEKIEFCVEMSRAIKIFDWDNAHYGRMPDHAKKSAHMPYHCSDVTNMNRAYDALGFLRLLRHHFPETPFVSDETVASLEPAFSEYAYVDPRDGEIARQVSTRGPSGDPLWPEIERLERALDEATRRAYVVAAEILLAGRKRRAREKFLLAVEGDNVEEIARYARDPVLAGDLDAESLSLAVKNARDGFADLTISRAFSG